MFPSKLVTHPLKRTIKPCVYIPCISPPWNTCARAVRAFAQSTMQRRSASPGRPGPPPRNSNVPSSPAENVGDECRLPRPLDELGEAEIDALAKNSECRIYNINGQLFYSPNTSRDVRLPERWPEGLKENILKRQGVELRDFQRPSWYHPKYRFLPYVPIHAFFEDLICAPLRRKFEEESDFVLNYMGNWTMPPDVIEEWLAIQKQLLWLITWCHSYKSPGQRELRYASDVGFQRSFLKVEHGVALVRRSKNWFMMLFSYATWILSDHNIFSNPDRENSGLWKSLIEHVDVEFLRCFVNSTIVAISPQIPRVGCFFDLASYSPEDLGRTGRQLIRFIYSSIPVWYPLNSDTDAIFKHRAFERFRPPPELIEKFEADRSAPIPRAPMYADRDILDKWRNEVAEETSKPSKSWEVFFESREQSHARRLAKETKRQRQRRLDMEKHAATSWSDTSAFFKWVLNANTGVHVRTRLTKNEESPASPPPTPERYYGWEAATVLPGNIGKRIPFLFGLDFTDLPSASYEFEANKYLYRAFGGKEQPKPLPKTAINESLHSFFNALPHALPLDSAPEIPRSDLLPLRPFLLNELRNSITYHNGSYIIATPGDLRIVVFHPSAAIFCVRLMDRDFDHVVLSLYRHGIRFNVCIELSTPPPPPPAGHIFPIVPIRLPEGTVLDKGVYDNSLTAGKLYLVGHRRRAALLSGGLVSRIAQDMIGSPAECERLIFQHPSPNVLGSALNVIVDLGDGRFLYDDVLETVEKDYLLGIHYVTR
ncbi:hypothetical protein EST38_g11025, partial [Candolleomyces aberdarensis]